MLTQASSQAGSTLVKAAAFGRLLWLIRPKDIPRSASLVVRYDLIQRGVITNPLRPRICHTSGVSGLDAKPAGSHWPLMTLGTKHEAIR